MTQDTTTHADLDLDGAKALKDFEDAKAIIREAEKAKADAEARVRQALGTATEGRIAGVTVVKVTSATRVTVSATALKDEDEAMYNRLAKVTAYTVLKTA